MDFIKYHIIRIILILLFSLQLCILKSQTDSLNLLEDKALTSTGIDKVDLLLNLSEVYLNQHPQKTLDLASNALELSRALNDLSRQARSLILLGDAHRMKGENIKALDFYLQAEKIYNQLSDKTGTANCANNIGRIYRIFGDFASALDYNLTALQIYEELKDEAGIASSLINSGVTYRNLGNKEIALNYYTRALDISTKINDLTSKASALTSIGNIYWYDNENNEALSYYEQALSITGEKDYKGEHAGGILNNIGNVHRKLGDLNKAIGFYTQALNISQGIGDQNQIAITYKNIGIAKKELKQYSEAIRYLTESKNLAANIRLLKIQRETLEQLSFTYTLLADYKKALEYYMEYSSLNDSLFNEETSNKISLLNLKHNLIEQENQKTIIQKDTVIKDSKERNLRNIMIFLTLLATGITLLFWKRYRLKLKKNEELQKLNIELEKRVEERTKLLRIENEQRRIAQEQAELANDTKNRFLATISHEVRTPINAIIGFCDLAMMPDMDNEYQLNLKRVKDSSEHLLAMIKDVLDYSQIESGKMELKNAPFDLFKLITSVVNAYYLDASSKNIKLTCTIDEKIPRSIIGDQDALRQVLYNLIGNAIKFTDKGFVEVSVKFIEKESVSEKINLRFSVKDTGIGISKLKQKLIFMDFTQLDNTASRKYGGVGLGLTISKFFVEKMGGKISVQSDKGAGSEFTFNISLSADLEKSEAKVKKAATKKKKLHLLVAEDNPLNCHVISAFLKRLGHTSEIVSNGKYALEILSKKDFDAVLMDIEMPEMDGIQATEAIRQGLENVRNPKISIIALTAHALKDYEEKSLKAGMDGYLTKPIDLEKLSLVLQSL